MFSSHVGLFFFVFLRYAPFAIHSHFCALTFTFLLGKAKMTVFSILLSQRANSVPVLEYCVPLRNSESCHAGSAVPTHCALHLNTPGWSVSEAVTTCRINSL